MQQIGRRVVGKTEPECLGGMLTRAPQSPGERFQLCHESLSRMTSLGPLSETNPPDWNANRDGLVNALHMLASDVERIRSSAQAFPEDFAAWRNHVHNLEASNAARLQVIVWMLQTLYSLCEDEEIGPAAGQMANKLADVLENSWRLNPLEVPMTGDYRAWCSRVTRNYRMLPKPWRYA